MPAILPRKPAAAAPSEDLTQHPAYAAGVADAHSGIAPNPFTDKASALDAAAPGGAAATLPRAPGTPSASAPGAMANVTLPADRVGRTYPSVTATSTTAQSAASAPMAPVRGMSAADQNPGHKWDSAWSDGTFKSAGQRSAEMMGGGVGALPRAPQTVGPTPPVGGTQAVIPPSAPAAGGNTVVKNPDGTETTTFSSGGTAKVWPLQKSGANQLSASAPKPRMSPSTSASTFNIDGSSSVVDKEETQPAWTPGAQASFNARPLMSKGKVVPTPPPQLAGLPRARKQTAVAQNSRDFFRR